MKMAFPAPCLSEHVEGVMEEKTREVDVKDPVT